MKIIIDECVPSIVKRGLPARDIKTVQEMGWAGIKNGELLTLAEKEFDVFITVDRNLSFQQNLPKFNIAVLVLHASSNRLADLRLLAPKILSTLPTLTKGEAEHVGI